MVVYLKNRFGDISCFAEFWTVDGKGSMVLNGDYLYINNIYICPKYRKLKHDLFGKIIKKISNDIHNNVRTVYWVRDKYNGKIFEYPIHKFIERYCHELKRKSPCAA